MRLRTHTPHCGCGLRFCHHRTTTLVHCGSAFLPFRTTLHTRTLVWFCRPVTRSRFVLCCGLPGWLPAAVAVTLTVCHAVAVHVCHTAVTRTRLRGLHTPLPGYAVHAVTHRTRWIRVPTVTLVGLFYVLHGYLVRSATCGLRTTATPRSGWVLVTDAFYAHTPHCHTHGYLVAVTHGSVLPLRSSTPHLPVCPVTTHVATVTTVYGLRLRTTVYVLGWFTRLLPHAFWVLRLHGCTRLVIYRTVAVYTARGYWLVTVAVYGLLPHRVRGCCCHGHLLRTTAVTVRALYRTPRTVYRFCAVTQFCCCPVTFGCTRFWLFPRLVTFCGSLFAAPRGYGSAGSTHAHCSLRLRLRTFTDYVTVATVYVTVAWILPVRLHFFGSCRSRGSVLFTHRFVYRFTRLPFAVVTTRSAAHYAHPHVYALQPATHTFFAGCLFGSVTHVACGLRLPACHGCRLDSPHARLGYLPFFTVHRARALPHTHRLPARACGCSCTVGSVHGFCTLHTAFALLLPFCWFTRCYAGWFVRRFTGIYCQFCGCYAAVPV